MTYWIVSVFFSIIINGPVVDGMTVKWKMEQVEFYGMPSKTKDGCIRNLTKLMEQTDPFAPTMFSAKCVPAQIGDFPKLEKIYEIK